MLYLAIIECSLLLFINAVEWKACNILMVDLSAGYNEGNSLTPPGGSTSQLQAKDEVFVVNSSSSHKRNIMEHPAQ